MTQKLKGFPNINLVWLSKAGKAPKKIKVIGNKNHWKIIERFFNLDDTHPSPKFFGRGGKSKKEIMPETSMPIIAKVIKVEVNFGKL